MIQLIYLTVTNALGGGVSKSECNFFLILIHIC
jgi:hypothetical protein